MTIPPHRRLFHNTNTSTNHMYHPMGESLMVSRPHQLHLAPLRTCARANLAGRVIDLRDWVYKACTSTNTSTNISISTNTSISTRTNILPHNLCRTKFQEHSHLCLLRQAHTIGRSAIGNVMWVHRHRAVGRNIRRFGARTVSGHLCLHRLLRDNARGSASGRGRGTVRPITSHLRLNRANMPIRTYIITTRIRTRSIRRRTLRLEGATRMCTLYITMHRHLLRVQGAETESGSMKVWAEGGGTENGSGKGTKCRCRR